MIAEIGNKLKLAGAVVGICLAASTADAALLGSTSGPDDSFSINFNFSNSDPLSITSLSVDGSTATAFPIVWDSIGTPGGTATLDSSSGVDTSVMTFAFLSFLTGDTFTLSGVDPDGAPGPLGVTIGQMAGVTVLATFSDSSTFSGVFVDDPAQGAGLQLVAAVPIPATALLLLGALGGLSAMRRRPTAA